MRMADQLEYLNLPGDTFDVRFVQDLGLLQDLDGHLLARQDVRRHLHLPKSALSQRLPEHVVSYRLRYLGLLGRLGGFGLARH